MSEALCASVVGIVLKSCSFAQISFLASFQSLQFYRSSARRLLAGDPLARASS